ncbi:MAG: Cna B-type domain-containing protein, partial [Ruminiclostridium sp.]
SGGDAYASYYIDINKDEVKIGTGDTITVTDKLGSRLDLSESSVTISPSSGASYSYDPTTHTIVFTLENSKYYRIEYTVDVRQIGKSENPTDNEISEKFANSVMVEGQGANNVSSVALINDSTYRSTADYVFDENKAYIELSGSKLWSNEANSSLVPAKVTVVIKRTKNGSPDADYEKTYVIQPDELGNWKFESGSLLTKDSDGTEYAYNVSEVEVEGYTASYKLDGSVISGSDYIGGGVVNAAPQQISFDITNTYTPELGSLTVNKVWAGESAAKPSKITITLTGDDGSSYTKDITVAGTGDQAVFTGIPLKKYSVNSSGEIVSVPVSYKITESATDDDAAILANYTLKYNGVEVTEIPVTVTAAGETVTITNEYNAPAPATGSLTVIKAWEGLTADAVIPGQLIISLYGDGVLVESKAIDVAAGESSVTFSNLPIKNAGGSDIVYHIAESVAGADAAILAEYTLKYNGTAMEQVPVTVSESGSSVTITNAYTPVLGKLTVNKVWSNITTDTVKPSEITITLYDLSGNSYVKTINIAGGETSAVFDNLPVYKYSVNADNTVTKTPIKYYVIETASGDNAAILANFTAEYPGTDDTVSGKRIFDLECEGYNKAVDILNTYNGGGTGSSSSVTTTASDTTTTTTTTTASD